MISTNDFYVQVMLIIQVVFIYSSWNTWLACSFLPFSDGCGKPCNHVVSSQKVLKKKSQKGLQETGLPQAVQSCHVQSEGVKKESKGLQENVIQLHNATCTDDLYI